VATDESRSAGSPCLSFQSGIPLPRRNVRLSTDCGVGMTWVDNVFQQTTSLKINHAAGVAVFLPGLKNGSTTTVAETLCRTASTVISIWSRVPGFAWPEETLASAIIFFRIGDQVVEVALPTCVPPLLLKTGTATRDAMLGACGARPASW